MKFFKKLIENEKLWQKIIIFYLVFYFVAITILLLGRWNQFEIYYFDHGIFDQSLWHVAHGRMPLFDHYDNYRLNQLGDHFTLVLYLLAPIYWLTSSYLPLLIIGNLLLVAAFFVLSLVGKELKLKNFYTFAILFAASLFIGLQNGIIAAFHTELIAMLTLALSFLFLEKKNYKWMWLFLILTVLSKEIFVGILAAFALLLFFRKEKKQALALMIFAVSYYFLTTRLILPYFRGDKYLYQMPPLNPFDLLKNLFLPTIKTKTILISLASFAFLPILSWQTLPLIGQDLFIRFVLADMGASWDLGMHYSLILTIILAYSSLLALKNLKKKISIPWIVLLILIAPAISYKLNPPLKMVLNKAFYQQNQNTDFLHNYLKQIPNKGLTMAPNNLAVKMTHHYDVMLLRNDYWKYLPETIVLDTRAGQGANNYWPASLEELAKDLELDPNYQKHKITDEQLYFTKNEKVDLDYYQKFD